MGKTAILAIRIIGDATEAVASLETVDGKTKGMEDTMRKASVASAAALGGIAAAAVAVGNAASEAEQATGAVDSVFGQYAGRIQEYATAAAQAVGLSETSYNQLASVLGAQLKNMGLDLEAAAGQTDSLIGLGADLAATFGGTTADAVAALSSLLRGERDPIERYGVSIKEADIAAEAAALGMEDLYKAGDRNATLQATLSLLTRQTADAQGQFGREAETAAGQQQRAQAAWENAAATLGEQLLPLMSEGALILADVAGWVSENSTLVTVLAAGIGILAAGVLVINGAMKAYAAIQAIQTAAQWANNAAWLASPITWIILAIVAAIALVVGIVVLLIQNWEEVQRTASNVWAIVLSWIDRVRQGFDYVLGSIRRWWNGLVADWTRGINNFIAMIQNAIRWLGNLVTDAMPGWLKDMLGISGQTFTAQIAVEEPPMVATRMAFTADETMAGFAQPEAYTVTTAGLAAGASDPGGFGGGSAPGAGGVTHLTVNFNGLVTDPEAAAREIRELLDDSDKNNGRKPAAAVGT